MTHMDIITKIASSELQLIARILDFLTLEDLIRIDFVCNTWREILEASFEQKYSMIQLFEISATSVLVTDIGDRIFEKSSI